MNTTCALVPSFDHGSSLIRRPQQLATPLVAQSLSNDLRLLVLCKCGGQYCPTALEVIFEALHQFLLPSLSPPSRVRPARVDASPHLEARGRSCLWSEQCETTGLP